MQTHDNFSDGFTDPMDEGILERDFVSKARPARGYEPSESDDSPTVRAYMLTSGRTTTTLDLNFESMVSVNKPQPLDIDLRFERGATVALCERSGAQSIAELSARLAIPIGVAKVIAGDLVEEGVLSVHSSQNANVSSDVMLLRRLIHGVRAL
jgi:Protein of unknown function (DUF742)